MEINPTSRIAARAIDNDASIDTRRLLKQVARRLIAENGVRNVTVRQIAEAARQKNRGVVAYYFRTKENLLAEILIEGAARIESRREVYLAELEATGGPLDPARSGRRNSSAIGRFFRRGCGVR